MSKLPNSISVKIGSSCVVNAKVIDKDHLCCDLCKSVVVAKVFDKHVALRHPLMFKDPRDVKAAAQLRHSSTTASREVKKPCDKQNFIKMVETSVGRGNMTVVDGQHVRCEACAGGTVIKLGAVYAPARFLQHFELWHSKHKCSGSWLECGKIGGYELNRLSKYDIACLGAQMQCIWCGLCMNINEVGEHFTQRHQDSFQTPNCWLCLQEVIVNAQVMEEFGDGFRIVMPENDKLECSLCSVIMNSLDEIRTHIVEHHYDDVDYAAGNDLYDEFCKSKMADPSQRLMPIKTDVSNSRQLLSKSGRQKRRKVQPVIYQSSPCNSPFVELTDQSGVWRCKLCGAKIAAAVISAGALKHYKKDHKEYERALQKELAEWRIAKISQGCLDLTGPRSFKCSLCDKVLCLNQDYNLSTAVRHLRRCHNVLLPENSGDVESFQETLDQLQDLSPSASCSSVAQLQEPTTQPTTQDILPYEIAQLPPADYRLSFPFQPPGDLADLMNLNQSSGVSSSLPDDAYFGHNILAAALTVFSNPSEPVVDGIGLD